MDLRKSIVVTAQTVLFASFFCVLVPATFGASQAQKRLHSSIDDGQTYVLKGNTRPAVSGGIAQDLGPVSPSQPMPRLSLNFSLTAAQQTDLKQLLSDQQNRRSPLYRKFLTPEEYAARFGLHTADIQKVTQWLENNGFSNIQTARSRTSISFSGSVAQVQLAFHTSIHSYALRGESHIANAGDPELPRALQGVVESVGGLHNFLPKPKFVTGSGTNYLVPDDWETIYDVKPLYSASLDGSPATGETYSIAIVGQSQVQPSDLHAFRAAAGLAVKDPTVLIVPGDNDPGLQSASGDQGESDLDLEWAGAIAKNANILFIVADSNPHGGVQDAIQYAINNSVAPILITSYGQCEGNLTAAEFNTWNALYHQASTQGMTVIAPSGDDGAADCDTGSVAQNGLQVSFPASSQYVTGVGGTEFNPPSGSSYFASSNNGSGGTAQSYIPEIAWNDGNLTATGGGASSLVAKPSWQTGTGVPSDGQRDVPDLAFTASIAHYGLVFCNNGSCTNGFLNSNSAPAVTGGTSAGPPAFGGVMALLVQKYGRVGLLNSNLYSLASISGNAFHDITAGTNQVACKGGSTGCPTSVTTATGEIGYSAGVGYDQTTGLGSIDSYNFVEQWLEDIQVTANPTSLSVPPGTQQTATITVAPVNNFTGPVSFSCSVAGNISNIVSCSVPSTTINTAGSITLTLTAAANPASSFPLQRLRPQIPTSPQFPNLALLLVVFTFGLGSYGLYKARLIPVRSIYQWSGVAIVLLTLGAVSCGSGSAAGTLSVTCTLPEPLAAVPYNGGNCVASGGKGPYTYSVETVANGGTGVLPAGLTLNSSTGSITGTATTAGVYPFTLSVTDSESSAKTITQAESLTVGPAPLETGLVTVTAKSGAIVNTTSIVVTTSL